MAIKHLNEQQMQRYMENYLLEDKDQIDQHLVACSECQNKINAYREVYQALRTDPLPALSDQFSQDVMHKLNISPEKSWAWREYLFSGVVVLVAIASLLFWTKPWSIFKAIAQAIGEQVNLFTGSILPVFSGKLGLILMICAILVVIEVLDYKFLRPRLRHFN